jgi:hypothetical protein
MAQGTKITFSEAELDAILHPDFFYTKHAAMQKVMELLSETERILREIIVKHPSFAEHTNIDSPKIFRGENYRKLPYMVLDYPRRFSTETIFAFRTMFWWGKEFSFTLHLQHAALEHFRNSIIKNISELAGNQFYYSVHKTPWEYYFEPDNYRPLDDMLKEPDFKNELQSAAFVKLSRKIPIGDFENVSSYAGETLIVLLKLLQDSEPSPLEREG